MPNISVIVPVYNAEQSIGFAIESLNCQTYKDFEAIFINDGSTDKSIDILMEWQKKSLINIKIVNCKNGGPSRARNEGLKIAKGKYIAFLDADDSYEPEFLQTLISEYNKDDVDFVCCGYKRQNHYYTDDGETNDRDQSIDFSFMNRIEWLDFYIHRKHRMNFWSVLYKLDIIHKNQIQFNESLKYGEDNLFFCDYLYYCKKDGALTEMRLYNYYDNNLSLTHTISYESIRQALEATKIIDKRWAHDIPKKDRQKYSFYDRALWSEVKNAVGDKKIFNKVLHNFDVKSAMTIMTKYGESASIKFSSRLYLIHPMLFYYCITSYNNINRLFISLCG